MRRLPHLRTLLLVAAGFAVTGALLVGDVVTGADPRFLGAPVPLTGDARASDG